jgi:hypothetical protein
MSLRLDHVILPVGDLQPSIDSFTSILGCTLEAVYFFDPNRHLIEIRDYSE